MQEVNIQSLMDVTYGLYIISSKAGDKINGCIGNAITQTSAEPPTMAVCVNQKHLTHEYIEESGVFSISILAKDLPRKTLGDFGFKTGRDVDKFADVEYMLGETGAPILTDYTLSYIEAEVIEEVEIETHTMFIGKIVKSDFIDQDKEPLTYDYYHNVMKGKSPEGAPTYTGGTEKKEASKVEKKKYKCEVCGYVYDPEQGDPQNDVEAGTAFSDLPHGWKCPVCGADKDQFFPVETKTTAPEKSEPEAEETETDLPKYECDVCGYVYDPAQGDPDSGIEPGTAWEDVPEDWVCPICGVGKDQFTKLD